MYFFSSLRPTIKLEVAQVRSVGTIQSPQKLFQACPLPDGLKDFHWRQDEEVRWVNQPSELTQRGLGKPCPPTCPQQDCPQYQRAEAKVEEPAACMSLNYEKSQPIVTSETQTAGFGGEGDGQLFWTVCIGIHSFHLLAPSHGISWLAHPETKVPAQTESSRTTEESFHPPNKPRLIPTHPGTGKYGVCCTIIRSCQVNNPALFKNFQDSSTAFQRKHCALSPTTHLLLIPPPLLPLQRLPFCPSSLARFLWVTLAHSFKHLLMPQASQLPPVFPLPKLQADLYLLHTQWPPIPIHSGSSFPGTMMYQWQHLLPHQQVQVWSHILSCV